MGEQPPSILLTSIPFLLTIVLSLAGDTKMCIVGRRLAEEPRRCHKGHRSVQIGRAFRCTVTCRSISIKNVFQLHDPEVEGTDELLDRLGERGGQVFGALRTRSWVPTRVA